MERLTKKDDFFDYVLPEQNIFGDNQVTEISLGETEYTCKLHITGEAIKRFGEFEDVLEKYNIENIGDLELRLEDIEHYAYQENKQLIDILAKYGIDNLDDFIKEYSSRNIKLANDNYALKQELADLQHKLKVSEMTTKLACDELRALNYKTFNNADIDFEQLFKEQSEKEVKGE